MIGGSITNLLAARVHTRRMMNGSILLLLSALWVLILGCSTAKPPEIAAEPTTPITTSDSLTWPPPREMTSVPTHTTASQSEALHSPIATEIRATYKRRYEAYWECLRRPVACNDSYLWPAGPAAQHMASVRSEMVARDRHVGSEPVGYYRVEQIQITTDQRSAEVTACWWSTAVLYGAPIYPDLPLSEANPLSLVTSTPEGGRQRDRFLLSDGAWLLVSSTPLDQGFAEDPCAA
jgi:hypothetical protein